MFNFVGRKTFNLMSSLEGIEIRTVEGGLEAITQNIYPKFGIAQKLYNKQEIEPVIKIFDKKVKMAVGSVCKKTDISIYHKKYSIYKWLTVTYDIDQPLNPDMQIFEL